MRNAHPLAAALLCAPTCPTAIGVANAKASICTGFISKSREPSSLEFGAQIAPRSKKEAAGGRLLSLNDVSFNCCASGETEPGNCCLSNSDHRVRLHCCPYVPGSSPGKTPDDRLAVQMEQSWVGRSRSRSLEYRGKKPADNRSLPHLGRSSLPYGKACSAWGSNNRVPERTPDPQR